jgi:large subunit ribosomal protein L17
MRHKRAGRQLSRDSEHRKALRRNMAQSLFEHGKVRTTLPRALEVQPFAEKLITLAKRATLHARRQVIAYLNDRRLTDEQQEFILNQKGNEKTVVQRLFDEIAPRFKDRSGGYTRIIKLPEFRIGDGGDLVLLQLLGHESEQGPTGSARKSRGLRRQRNERRFQFARKALKPGGARSKAGTDRAAE